MSVAFVFPGQGSQRVGMLEALASTPDTANLLRHAEESSGLPLGRIAAEGPAIELADTRAAQPLLFIADLVWARAAEAVVAPSFVAGHSLGELAALSFAGVFPAEVGIELVCARGRIMAETAEAVPGGMAAVLGMARDDVAGLLEGASGVWIANDNSAAQAVISGTHAGIEWATAALLAAGARKVVPLDVAGPFHCPLMAPAAEEFARLLEGVDFSDARMPVLQNTDPTPATDAGVLKERLLAQITAPVRWRETMSALAGLGATTLVETGPGAVLTGLARRTEGLTAVAAEADGIDHIVEVVS